MEAQIVNGRERYDRTLSARHDVIRVRSGCQRISRTLGRIERRQRRMPYNVQERLTRQLSHTFGKVQTLIAFYYEMKGVIWSEVGNRVRRRKSSAKARGALVTVKAR